MSTNHKLRIGIIGLGAAGAGMFPAITMHPGIELAGAADIDSILRKNFARDHKLEVDESAAALVRRDAIDAVYIATPHQYHCDHTILALEHGKHVIVEKPMSLSLQECDRMIDAAERHGKVMIVGHSHSFDAPIRVMREIIASGELGRVAMIAMFNYTDFLYRPRREEELDTERGGGILFNQIPHQVDTARLLVGEPVRSVRAVAGILDPTRRTEGSCMAFLDFEGGATASLVYSGYDHFDSDEFHGWIGERGQPKRANHGAARRSLGKLIGAGAEEEARRKRYGYGLAAPAAIPADIDHHQPHFGTVIVSCAHGDMRPSADGVMVYADDGAREIPIDIGAGLAGRDQLLDELCNAVFKGIAPVHNGRFARGTVETALAILRSSRERREVRLK
ncbi:MAG: Gfo/Idh/MocA family protein [Burkholderiales bacterium]